eukprot:2481940-Amphidinium_carterae.3
MTFRQSPLPPRVTIDRSRVGAFYILAFDMVAELRLTKGEAIIEDTNLISCTTRTRSRKQYRDIARAQDR